MPRALPLGELSPQVTERAHAVSPILKYQRQEETLPPCQRLPLGGGWHRVAMTGGVQPPPRCIQIDISVCCILRRLLIYQPGEIRTFFALLIYQFRQGVCPPQGRRRKGRAVRTAVAKRKILQAEREMQQELLKIPMFCPCCIPDFYASH